MRHLLTADEQAGARFSIHQPVAGLNPSLAPRGLGTFVLGVEHPRDVGVEDGERLLSSQQRQTPAPRRGSASTKPARARPSQLLLEALPAPGCLEACRPPHFLQALNHGQLISVCACASTVLCLNSSPPSSARSPCALP